MPPPEVVFSTVKKLDHAVDRPRSVVEDFSRSSALVQVKFLLTFVVTDLVRFVCNRRQQRAELRVRNLNRCRSSSEAVSDGSYSNLYQISSTNEQWTA